ncbi:MAG: alpha/beta fold hydrolase [Burkholderiales bacterium]|nr:alpha/beta fold hydrolase [Burkholderiales bacterium]
MGLRDSVAGAEYGRGYLKTLGGIASLQAKSTQATLERLGRRQSEAAQVMGAALARAKPGDYSAYLADAWERWVLFADILRQRGNNFVRHEEQGCPPVLAYDYEVVVDGTSLERPVNYSLVWIRPPEGATPRPNARPYIIIDPRAGHGSGIGGFKSESEVGVALRGGHPVYFCIFTTHPTRTQTLADVTRAEAHFVREVQRRHPDAPKPVVIGNCQGGWAAMLLAATNPDLTGPVVVNGTPLSYWAGTVGRNPMRYMGGLCGGIVPALMLSDLGNGQFDGANLVLNFENLNPGNSWWKKYYEVYAGTEQGAERYLEFERWWSGFYFMNEPEMRWLVENLFVGNRLGRGGAQLDSRMHVDLRNVRAPVIVFASHGDNITPPAQALNWITDAYSDVKEIKARGQRIVYTVHDSIGHLGIFVSSEVARKEHKEIVSTLKAIEALSPGLYEMKIVEEKGEGLEKRFVVDFEERSIGDLLALDDGRDDEKAFAAVARLSQLGADIYRMTLSPWVRALTNSDTSRWRINTQPLRMRRYLMSDKNPLLAAVGPMAAAVHNHRHKADAANPLLGWEKAAAGAVTDWFDAARDLRDAWMESMFYAVYSSPLMRAIGAAEAPKISEVAGTDLRAIPEVRQALAQMKRGNLPVAVIRMLVLLAKSRKAVRRDRLQRSNELLTAREPYASLGETARTRIIHQQSMIVEFEPEQALATLPALVTDPAERERAMQDCDFVVGDPAAMSAETRDLYERIRRLLEQPPVQAQRAQASEAEKS